MFQQGADEAREGLEGVVELLDGGRLRQPETQVVGGDHVVAPGEQGHQGAEHERARGRAVQQEEGGCRGIARLAVEDLTTVDQHEGVVHV
jgi:hypothetical protein